MAPVRRLVMAKHNKTGRSKNTEGQYVIIPYRILKSDAWRSLNGNSIRVFFELHTKFYGENNGRLFIGMDRIAKDLGISKSTVSSAFKELEQKGFIVKTKNGDWVKGQATEWRLTTQRVKSASATNDWKEWKKPKDQPKKRRPYGLTKQIHADYVVTKMNSSVPN
jgi:DNA-binding HxlR family transcriptional regulator